MLKPAPAVGVQAIDKSYKVHRSQLPQSISHRRLASQLPNWRNFVTGMVPSKISNLALDLLKVPTRMEMNG